MALVSYDYDSSSENEEEQEDNTASVIIPKKDQIYTEKLNEKHIIEDSVENASPISKLFSELPKTKNHISEVVEDKLEDFIPKYQPAPKDKGQKVKITIPSLSQFIDDDEPVQKKAKTISKGCSLLSLLPPVQGSPLTNTSFIPKILKNKPVDNRASTSNLVPNTVRRKAELAKKAAVVKITKLPSGTESDDDVELPESFDEEMWKKVCGRPKFRSKEIQKQIAPPSSLPPVADFNIAPDPVEPYDGLDNAAFKALVGKSKMPVNIKLIDINEGEVLSDKDMWMTKSLTDPENYPKPEIEEPVDPTRKKKHHITYLAEQAKANEQEFKSQWAASKHTRTQTRAKYGF